MASLPFSAPKPRSLPTITQTTDITQTLAAWQTQLAASVRNVAPQPTPQNFSITNSRGGLTLNWSPVLSASGADGYEILKSANGSFTDDLQIIPVKNVNQSNFFDSLGGASSKASYRLRTTSGTAQNPQSQRGPESGVIQHTSIDSSDTASVPVTKFDTYTTDATRSLARLGNYGAINLSNTGQAGAASRASSTTSSGSNSNTNGAGVSFASLTSSKNVGATLIVAANAKVVPDAANPGIIAATQLQSVQVSVSSTPSNSNALQYNSTNNDLEYAATAQTIASTSHEWLNSYTASTGTFTATQPAASDLSNGTTGTGTVVLSVAPALTGVPTAPTAAGGTNTTQLATTAFVQTALGSYLPLAGGTLVGVLNGTSAVLSGSVQSTTHILTAATPTVTAGQVGLGTTTAATATAGAATLPAAPTGFLVVNLGGVTIKVPYYSN